MPLKYALFFEWIIKIMHRTKNILNFFFIYVYRLISFPYVDDISYSIIHVPPHHRKTRHLVYRKILEFHEFKLCIYPNTLTSS